MITSENTRLVLPVEQIEASNPLPTQDTDLSQISIDKVLSQLAASVSNAREEVVITEGVLFQEVEIKDKFAKLKKTATATMVIFGALSQISGVEKINPEGGITFLPQPKVNQTIENKRIEVDSQFKQAKSAGVERVAVQLPNNSEEE
jgi:hypothetical protein